MTKNELILIAVSILCFMGCQGDNNDLIEFQNNTEFVLNQLGAQFVDFDKFDHLISKNPNDVYIILGDSYVMSLFRIPVSCKRVEPNRVIMKYLNYGYANLYFDGKSVEFIGIR